MFWTNTAIDILLFFYVIDCIFMGFVIMMQRSKQEGLGAAFGSGMMSDTFGAQTSQVLVKATVWATILFFILSISLARLYSNRAALMEKGSAIQQELSQPVAKPATSPTPAVLPHAPTNSAGQPVVPTATPMNSANAAPAKPPGQPAPVAPAKPAGK
jgi:preprotein translocase subunit SecG